MQSNAHKICLLPGDGIGPEIMAVAVDVLEAVGEKHGIAFEFEEALIGGCAIDACEDPLPQETLQVARNSDAVLLASVGGPEWDSTDPSAARPEDGLLAIRKELDLFANLRPITVYDALIDASPLKREAVSGTDILIMRELTGGLYFGDHVTRSGVEGAGLGGIAGIHAYDVMQYDEYEIERIARKGFEAAMKRRKKLTSVDKANVLDTSRLWRRVVKDVSADYPEVELSNMLVDNCAMQLIVDPSQFDVILTENTFGDILSDEASVISGSLGMLASASLGSDASLFEPCHGSAPDIAGKGIANPIGEVLSAAMLLSYGLGETAAANDVTRAVKEVLNSGWRTCDIADESTPRDHVLGTEAMGDRIIVCIKEEK